MTNNTQWKGWKPGQASTAFVIAFCQPLPPGEKAATRKALKRAMRKVGKVTGCDWLSSRGSEKVDLEEVCG